MNFTQIDGRNAFVKLFHRSYEPDQAFWFFNLLKRLRPSTCPVSAPAWHRRQRDRHSRKIWLGETWMACEFSFQIVLILAVNLSQQAWSDLKPV
jgi:hypothetical protein